MNVHVKPAPDHDQDMIPVALRTRLAEFMLDKRTGNLIIHVKSGKVVGGRLEELLTIG